MLILLQNKLVVVDLKVYSKVNWVADDFIQVYYQEIHKLVADERVWRKLINL
jgi:hypothetical protein